MKKTLNRKGFTLVELMVVVAIMGVLIAIAVPAYNNATAGAERAVCESNARTYESAIMQWMMADPTKNVPTSDLLPKTINADTHPLVAYMRDGLVTCPTDNSNYTIDTTTGTVVTCSGAHTPPTTGS